MATYVFFEGFGDWTLNDLPIVDSSYQSGYFMLFIHDERRYKHLGILSPVALVAIDGWAYGWAYREAYQDRLNTDEVYFSINYEEPHSVVVVDLNLKDIQTADQHPSLQKWLAQTSSQESEVSTMQTLNTLSNPDYITKDLAILNRAAIELWGNVDPNDKTKHPDQPTVIKWLKLNKISSEASAIQGATIIRPNWAKNNGRPTKKEV